MNNENVHMYIFQNNYSHLQITHSEPSKSWIWCPENYLELKSLMDWGMKVLSKRFSLHLKFWSRRPEGRVFKRCAKTWVGSFLMPITLLTALFLKISSMVCCLDPMIFSHVLTIPFNFIFSLTPKDPNQQIIEKANIDCINDW